MRRRTRTHTHAYTRVIKVENNNPHLVLFVGEALVGNDGVDQLSMFNKVLWNTSAADDVRDFMNYTRTSLNVSCTYLRQALIDYSSKQTPRGIDGIILTKFDTVDEKVRLCQGTRAMYCHD